MNKLSNDFLKYMIDANKTVFSFDDFENLKPDIDKCEIIEALNFLKHHGYITAKSYDNLPAIIRITPSAQYFSNPNDDLKETTADQSACKDRLSDRAINFIGAIAGIICAVGTIVGTIIAVLAFNLKKLIKEMKK